MTFGGIKTPECLTYHKTQTKFTARDPIYPHLRHTYLFKPFLAPAVLNRTFYC